MYGDDLIRQKRGDAFLYYQYDGQLSVRQLTDGTGNVTDTYTYDAFGDVLSQSGSTENSYLYTGEQFDPNAGFYYLRARYYDPAAGRFLSSDPWKGNIYEPVTLHKYLYANANPVMYTDPSGLSVISSLQEFATLQVIRTATFIATHQRVFAFTGFILNTLLPIEVYQSMMSSGVPGIQVLGITGQAKARAFRLLKSKTLNKILNGHKIKGQDVGQYIGDHFEEFARQYLFKGGIIGRRIGNYKPDLIWRNFVIELKSGRWGGLRQLRNAANYATHEGKNLVYVFLNKPSDDVIGQIYRFGGRAVYIFDSVK